MTSKDPWRTGTGAGAQAQQRPQPSANIEDQSGEDGTDKGQPTADEGLPRRVCAGQAESLQI